ncbi:putative PIG3 family NAD(P)H quinone oxidoreductase [Sphingomonas vulcanisoli]|uniref:PIG3 family NAD(P)H quinone oxidoreductase n=1 Tax=Sphingomonas vulcanisoli TaxID=1658060 RepID=A0ABX0TUS1_9SPHN|nr:NAD(P)H-quinone oxidoreductase [Sphingomonas vulcanisoli]NIJ09201.1 putative PIG3 family NAD(P)H quinone oxidoreductase [Sphingomonas vulcanisoli]
MADLPKSMIAVDPAEPGGPEVLVPVERPVPRPGPAEVLIRVAAAGVNRPEIMQREGKYPPPPGTTSILGMELAGEVVALGEGADPSLLGSNVCALVAGGAYAEYAVAPAAQCLPVPEALSLIEAGAMPETLLTVWGNVFHRGHAQAGETLLVHGGTSGIGTMAILLGKLFDLKVIVTAGGADKCARALEIGAAHAIDYKAQDFVAEIEALTGGKGVEMVLDMVGGDYVARNLQCLADEGRHISIAVQRGPDATIPIWQVMRRRLHLTGSTLRAREAAYKALLTAEIAAKVWPYVAAGDLRPVIDRTFPLAQAADAHRNVESGAHVGKTILTMD